MNLCRLCYNETSLESLSGVKWEENDLLRCWKYSITWLYSVSAPCPLEITWEDPSVMVPPSLPQWNTYQSLVKKGYVGDALNWGSNS